MRQIYRAGGFGRLVYSEGEYYHYSPTPIPSYKEWRIGLPPLWYPTHSTAYYIGVTGKRFTSVSCIGSNAGYRRLPARGQQVRQPLPRRGGPVPDQRRRLRRGCSCARACSGLVDETGRVFGEKGYMNEMNYQGHDEGAARPGAARPAAVGGRAAVTAAPTAP